MKLPPLVEAIAGDVAVVSAALSMTADAFAAAHRGLFLVPSRLVGLSGQTTARATPASRSADETAPWIVEGQAALWIALPPASPSTRAPLALGRSPDADLVLLHPTISRRHALIWPGDGFIEVCDLGSQHGTHVGSRRVARDERVAITLGERLRFADVDLTLVDARTVWRALHRDSAAP